MSWSTKDNVEAARRETIREARKEALSRHLVEKSYEVLEERLNVSSSGSYITPRAAARTRTSRATARSERVSWRPLESGEWMVSMVSIVITVTQRLEVDRVRKVEPGQPNVH